MKVEGLPALKKQLGVFALKAGGGAEVGPESPFSLVVITFPFYLHFVGPLRAEENLSEWQNPSIKEAALPGFARPSLSQLLINLHTVKITSRIAEELKLGYYYYLHPVTCYTPSSIMKSIFATISPQEASPGFL